MLKNPDVRQVKLNVYTGFCSIILENGELLQENGLYFQEDFTEYITSLAEVDHLSFSDKTNWILHTEDFLEDWKETLAKIGARSVSFFGHSEERTRAAERVRIV